MAIRKFVVENAELEHEKDLRLMAQMRQEIGDFISIGIKKTSNEFVEGFKFKEVKKKEEIIKERKDNLENLKKRIKGLKKGQNGLYTIKNYKE